MNFKEILDTTISREGLYRNVPNPFVSTDLVIQENVRICNELVKELTVQNTFSELLKEATFYTYHTWKSNTQYNQGDIVTYGSYSYKCLNNHRSNAAQTPDRNTANWVQHASKTEYKLADIAPDIKSIDTETMVNITEREPMKSVNMREWMNLKLSTVYSSSGIWQQRGESILLFPGLAEGTEIQFLYYTSKPVISAEGEFKTSFTNINDMCLIPESVLILGTAYRYLKDKDIGRWDELEKEYREQKSLYEARTRSPQVISLLGGSISGGSNITEGSWRI